MNNKSHFDVIDCVPVCNPEHDNVEQWIYTRPITCKSCLKSLATNEGILSNIRLQKEVAESLNAMGWNKITHPQYWKYIRDTWEII